MRFTQVMFSRPPSSQLASLLLFVGSYFNKRVEKGRILLNQIRIKNASSKMTLPSAFKLEL